MWEATVAKHLRQIEVKEPSLLRLWGKKGAVSNAMGNLLKELNTTLLL
jgi:hypothetical protein